MRNEDARDRLRRRIGEDIGLVMTIAEARLLPSLLVRPLLNHVRFAQSKGLEFSDVLLYDFFSDSSAR